MSASVNLGFLGLASSSEVAGFEDICIGGVTFPCTRLSDGGLVVSWRAFYRALGGANPGPRRGELPAFLQAENLAPFVGERLREALRASPVYTARSGTGGGEFVGYGIPVSLICTLCRVWTRASTAGALHHSQRHVAVRAQRVVAALEKGRGSVAA
jgi:hypothetical protein